ncbi:ABC transporter permease [Nonomuraea rhodomycinica]|uniref:ABC3 transporter permease C-terminal domain-containing protein n=1 Tax=Nonomuraea rhodomycinica TaxID=1712872 RepID=A0A7Y6IWB5_9ACTN|nr:ABC transporter permease [Nonomuraea rhodomycinica]NUW45023.1 hypothetical protein [Nonomuraea rhodomycinica]
MEQVILAVLNAALMVTILCVAAAPVCGSVALAVRSAPSSRHARVSRPHLAWGAVLSTVGIVVLVVTRPTRHYTPYDDGGLALTVLAALAGAALLLLGIGPFVSWLLVLLGRPAVRLTPPIRLAAHGAAGRRAAAAAATTASATALALTFMIVGTAQVEQDRAAYRPQARSGALVVTWPSPEQAAAVGRVVQQELPEVPIAQSYRLPNSGFLSLDIVDVDAPDLESGTSAVVIGDEALLRYLTAAPSTPYDEDTAVVITADDTDVDKVTIDYGDCGASSTSKILPAIAARSADPQEEKIFIPVRAVRDLGCRPEPEELVIDPSVHRTTAEEQERLDRRLGESGTTYIERGFQAPGGWKVFAGAALALALGAALTATRRTPADSRSRRVLLRVGGASTASLRWFVACRAGLVAVCGTVVGAAAGCVMGLRLVWPLTESSEWDAPPRVPFETPWPAIAVLVAGLPVLTAAIAAVLGVTWRESREAAAHHVELDRSSAAD